MKTTQEHTAVLQSVADSVARSSDPLPQRAVEADQPEWSRPSYVFSADPSLVSIDTLPVAGSAAAVFGARSRLETFSDIPAPSPQKPDRQEWNYLMLDGLTVLLLLFFLVHLYRYRGPIALLFRSLFLPGQFDTLVEEQSVAFRTFTRFSSLLGVISLLVIGFKWSILWCGSDSPATLPDPLVPYLLPLLAGVLLAVWLYKRIVLGIIAVLTGKSETIEKIGTFNRLYFTFAALFLAPAALLGGLADPQGQGWMLWAQVILLIILLLGYFWKSFSFFVSRKISILQWILYLCAVEIWPVSFFVLFAGRGFVW